MKSVRSGLIRLSLSCAFLLSILAGPGLSRLTAADPLPTAGPGATKDDVLKIQGAPTRQSKIGNREILTYPQGQFTLENGRVERVDLSASMPATAPTPRPSAGSKSTRPSGKAEPAAPLPASNRWMTSLDAAKRAASPRNARILVLFTGSDWSPAGRKFQDEVASHSDFLNTFAKDCVFLQLDFPMRTPITPALRQQNEELRQRFGVTSYPTLLVLTAGGEKIATVDLTHLPPGDSYRERVIGALRLADSTIGVTVPPPEVPPPPPPAALPTTSVEVTAALTRARLVVMAAIAVGLIIAGLIFSFIWRKRNPPPPPTARMAARISEAASGVPSRGEIKAWPKERLCSVTAELAKLEGYVPRMAVTDDRDIELKRSGEKKPCVFVCCAPASEGVVHAQRLRELVGTVTAEGVPAGWFVATMGFGFDARVYADAQNLLLIDDEQLLAKLRDLAPLLLMRVLLQESKAHV